MATPSVTHTFVANTTARAAQVNTNFTNIITALTDGTADVDFLTVNNLTITSSTGTLTIAAAKTLTCSNTLTFAGTDGSTVTLGAGGTVAYTANKLSVFAATTSLELKGVISDETGSGALVFADTPTLVTPILGTPTSGTLTNCTGLPVGGITGTLPVANGGTNSSTALNSNRFIVSSAGAIGEASAVTASRVVVSDVNGLPAAASTTTTQVNYLSSATGTTGTTSTNVVFSTSPTLVTPVLGAATATSINGLTITSSTGTLTITNAKTLSVSNTLTFTGTDSSTVACGAGGTVAYVANKLSVFAATSSSELAGVISDETGSGALVFGTSPTITTPTINGVTDGSSAASGVLGEYLTASGSSVSCPTGSDTTICTLTLTAGCWAVSACGAQLNTTVSNEGMQWKLNKLGAGVGTTNGLDMARNYCGSNANNSASVTFLPQIVNVTSATSTKTVVLTGRSITATVSSDGYISAIRLR